jgi:hypothetical protein
MPGLRASGLLAILPGLVLAGSCAGQTLAADENLPQVAAAAPSEVSVTVYRAPDRVAGSINLDALRGFAFISETRRLQLPAGRSRVRFAGVADGIEATSAIITGLPGSVIEKNRDAELLSPGALVDDAVGKQVELLRTDPKTGRTLRTPVEIRSATDGVVFTTRDGVEALRCSGLPETFAFTSVLGLSAQPTLSIIVETPVPLTAEVRLSYLSSGFDWAADYDAVLSADETSIDLGAWLTLANGNGASFPAAHAQIVAGRLNRVVGDVEPVSMPQPIVAQCWPRGSTSDSPPSVFLRKAGFDAILGGKIAYVAMAAPAAMLEERVFKTTVTQEQLGDLKLYRVPERTTVASRQAKQVRLLDREHVPVRRIYGIELGPFNDSDGPLPARILLRAKNDTAHHLGLPLPSGQIAVFARRGDTRLLLQESGIRDLALEEELELPAGTSNDVLVTRVTEPAVASTAAVAPVAPAASTASHVVSISNALAKAIPFELRVQVAANRPIVHADHRLEYQHGEPMFALTIPAHATVTVRYQTRPQ